MSETRQYPEAIGEPYPIPSGSILNWTPRYPTCQFTDDEGFTYPTYRGSKIHYETNDLAQLIVGDGKFARAIGAKIMGNTGVSLNREDILQEAALALMRTYRKGPPDYLVDEPSIYKLIFTIINSRTTDAFRTTQRKRDHNKIPLNTNDSRGLDTFEFTLADKHDVGEEGIASVKQGEEARAIQALRGQLSDSAQRIIDVMLAHPDLNGRERAELLQMTHGSYRVALHRMRASARNEGKRTNRSSSKPPRKNEQKKPVAKLAPPTERAQDSIFSGCTTIEEVIQQLHLEIQDQRANGKRMVELSAPAYIGQWALGAANLRTYFEQQQEPATAAIVTPDSQFDQLTTYLQPLLRAHKKHITFLTADDVRWARGAYFDYALMSTDIDASVLPKLRTHANFVLGLCCLSDAPYDAIKAPGYTSTTSDNWSETDSVRYIQELYFALGKAPTSNDIHSMNAINQGPSATQLSRDGELTSTEDLVKKSLSMLRGKKAKGKR